LRRSSWLSGMVGRAYEVVSDHSCRSPPTFPVTPWVLALSEGTLLPNLDADDHVNAGLNRANSKAAPAGTASVVGVSPIERRNLSTCRAFHVDLKGNSRRKALMNE
jgi:hypothetical protein